MTAPPGVNIWPWLGDKSAAADEWLRTAQTAAGIPGCQPVTVVNEATCP